MSKTVLCACHLCEASCGLEIDVDGTRVTAVRPDYADPISKGYVCPKGLAIGDLPNDPDRLRTPMRRATDGRFRPIGWDEAFDFVVARIDVALAHVAVRRQHAHAVAAIVVPFRGQHATVLAAAYGVGGTAGVAPGPFWAFYSLLAVALALTVSAIQWREGAYPTGTINAGHVFTGASVAAVLGLMHYQDKVATSAIRSFRPLLTSKDDASGASSQESAAFATLAYQLATLPAWPALLATVSGSAFASIAYANDAVSGTVASYLAASAGTAFSTASIMIPFILANGLFVLLVYHTIHQLLDVSRIYTNHTRIRGSSGARPTGETR